MTPSLVSSPMCAWLLAPCQPLRLFTALDAEVSQYLQATTPAHHLLPPYRP